MNEKRENLVKEIKKFDNQITDEFSSIQDFSILGNEFEIKSARKYWNERYKIDLIIKNEKYHWASEIVRAEFKINNKGEVESSFNNGSGGWNDFSAKRLLEVFESSLTMVRKAIKIAEDNSLFLYNLCQDKENIEKEIYKIDDEIKKLEKEKEEKARQAFIDDVMKDYRPVNGEIIIQELTANDERLKFIKLIQVVFLTRYNKLATKNIEVKIENFSQKRFKLNNRAISRKALKEFNFKNYFYANDEKINFDNF